MKIGDQVRTKQTQHSYGYKRPTCVVVSTRKRIDGLVVEIMDPSGGLQRWLEEDLEII